MNSFLQELNRMYDWLPGGSLVPIIFCGLGFIWGMYRYIRSFKYIYCYYIEHGIVIWGMDGAERKRDMNTVAKKYRLPDSSYFEPHGYVTGLGIVVLCTILGTVVGTLWPASLAIGVLTIPNIALRRVAKEKRNKAIFEQTLKGTK